MNKIPEKFFEILKHEGVVSIVTNDGAKAHVVNTWNSYIEITEDGYLLVPAGRMNKTQENLAKNEHVLVTLGSREVMGFHSKGTGYLIEGTAVFEEYGKNFDNMKQRFPWQRAVLVLKPQNYTQTL